MQLTLRNLFLEMGHDFNNMQLDVPIEVSGWEIESYDFNKKQNCWKDIKHIVRKESTKTYELINVETNNVIVQVSPLHKFWVKLDQTCDFAWIEAVELTNFDSFIVKSQEGEVSCRIELNEDIIEIADIEVEGTHCYYSNGILSHNTLYGDPTTTPGGHAIPFHSSVRIKLGAGSQILNKDKEPIGINVSAKTIKNKVAAPFRKCDFEIHFGKGIFEHEQIFDVLRKNGSETIDGYMIECAGSGAWKHLMVYSPDGELIVEKKFYKADFDKVMKDPQYKEWIDKLLEKVMVRKSTVEDLDIDPESYTEMEALSSELLGDDSAYQELS